MPMYDTTSLYDAGVPMNKNLLKYGNAVDQYGNTITGNPINKNLKYDSILATQSNQNRIETIERYMWTNVAPGLTPDLIERILYYRGKAIFYFNDNVNKFQFLPFALNGSIDEYGRYLKCNTLPFTGVETETVNGKKKPQMLVYQDLYIVYDFPFSDESLENIRNKKPVGIILNDSSLGINQQPVIRSNYVQPILHLMATVMQIINTAIFGAADHNLIQVENESELDSVRQQVAAINYDILQGKRFTPIVGKLGITPIKTSTSSDLEGLWNTYNSLSNFLKAITGVTNAGVFNKEAQLLQAEQKLNGSNSDDIYYNGLRMRQEFCMLIQAYYNYPIWCQSKRSMTEAEAQNLGMGETNDPDNTQFNGTDGGEKNGESGI